MKKIHKMGVMRIRVVIIIDHAFLIGIHDLTRTYQFYELNYILFLSLTVRLVPLRKKYYSVSNICISS